MKRKRKKINFFLTHIPLFGSLVIMFINSYPNPHLVGGRGRWFVEVFMLVNLTPEKKKENHLVRVGKRVFLTSIQVRSYVCLNYEKEKKMSHKLWVTRAPII